MQCACYMITDMTLMMLIIYMWIVDGSSLAFYRIFSPFLRVCVCVMKGARRITYEGQGAHPPRYEQSVWGHAILQPALEDSTRPDYWRTGFTPAEKRLIAGQMSRGERILPAPIEHPDEDKPVPKHLRLGYWREGWVDGRDNLHGLVELDGSHPQVQRYFTMMKENSAARERGDKELPHPNFRLGTSLKTDELQDQETKRVLFLDATHGCLTEVPIMHTLLFFSHNRLCPMRCPFDHGWICTHTYDAIIIANVGACIWRR